MATPVLAGVERRDDCFAGRFNAMASPCEVLVDSDQEEIAARALAIAAGEAWRIESKFSRYRDDNIVHRLNHAAGEPVEVDRETALLIEYAATCHQASGGLFDITSGVLRRAWTFDGGDRVPTAETVTGLLGHVGWERVTWRPPVLTLPEGMEIDLGGIGKEYAVDRAAALIDAELAGHTPRAAFLVNFGGDLFASGPRRGARPWAVGIDDPGRTGEGALFRVDLTRGGLATSGDARRFVRWKGRRLGHILNPKTGWPVLDAPRSVTVLAASCLAAGTLSTLAYLAGSRAADLLDAEGVQYRIV